MRASVGDSSHERPAPKRMRVALEQQSTTNVPGKQQPKKNKAQPKEAMLPAHERDQLESRREVESSKIIKLEDRIRGLLAQSDQQGEILRQRQETSYRGP